MSHKQDSRVLRTPFPLAQFRQEAVINIHDRIIAAVGSLVLDHDPARITLDDVSQAAGVTRAQLTTIFPDETALFRAVLNRGPDVMPESPAHRALKNFDSLDTLRAWADTFLEQQQRNGLRGSCPLTALAWHLVLAGGDARADVGAAFEQWAAMFSAGLRRICNREGLRPETDPDELASAMVAILQGGILLSRVKGDIRPLRSAVTLMISRARSLTAPEENPDRLAARAARPVGAPGTAGPVHVSPS